MATFRPKENARPEFLLMVMESWTYNRMTVDEKSACLDKIITATIKGRFLQRWTQLQAVFSAYLDSIGYSGAGWRDAQNATTEPETSEAVQDTTCTDTEPQESTETAQKTTDMETFKKEYSRIYNHLYEHEGQPGVDATRRKYSRLFDEMWEQIKDIAKAFCTITGDLLTSDRECAAFMKALETVGTPTDGNATTTTETEPQRAAETEGTRHAGETATTQRDTSGETTPRGNYSAAVLCSPMIRGRVAVCVGVLSRYGSIVSRSGVPPVVSAGMERHTPRHAFKIAPQRTEPAQPYTTTPPRNKTPPRGCYSFARFPP